MNGSGNHPERQASIGLMHTLALTLTQRGSPDTHPLAEVHCGSMEQERGGGRKRSSIHPPNSARYDTQEHNQRHNNAALQRRQGLVTVLLSGEPNGKVPPWIQLWL